MSQPIDSPAPDGAALDRDNRFRGIRTKLSPNELAAMWGKHPTAIIALIKLGELRAIDVSVRRGRPNYRIDVVDIAAFEARREVQPPAPRMRHRRASARPGGIEYV